MAHCLIGILILFLNVSGTAQHTVMRSYNINDGLVSNQVRGFYQDRKGFIWIMTWEGLSRHDGNAFRNYTTTEGLAHPLINSIIEGKDGRLYVAENDGSIDVILGGKVQKELRIKMKTPVNKMLPEPSGRILAPSDSTGVCVFDERTVTTLNQSGTSISVSDVISLSDDATDEDIFFVCGSRSGVMRHDHTFLEVWPDSIPEYTSVFKDTRDRIWVGTSMGLRWVKMTSRPEDRFDLILTSFANSAWSKWNIRDIIQTSDGSVWIAAAGGLIQVRPDQSWRLYGRKDGLPSDYITSIFEDGAGFLWIGTDQGFAQLDIKNTIDIFSTADGLPNNLVKDILPTPDGGMLFISDAYNVFRMRMNQPLLPIDFGYDELAYHFFIIDTDTMVTTDKGWYILNNNIVRLWDTFPNPFTNYSLQMNSGDIFSTTNTSITISSPTENRTYPAFNQLIFANSHVADTAVWIGTLIDGLYCMRETRDSSGGSELEWEDFNAYLPEKTIRSLYVDTIGNIWIGTRYSGLIQLFRDPVSGKYITQIFNRSDGFISDFIKSITSDREGNIWVGTHAGIEKLIPTDTGYRVFSFSRVHNFFAIVTTLTIGSDGSIWCATTSGVTRIRDCHYDTIVPSEVYITSISTARTILVDPLYQLPFDLKHNQNFIDIEFSSNDHINGKQIKYSYRLNGSHDTTWSVPKPVHKVSFASLLPGRYSFEVRVLGWNGLLGEKTSYTFRVLPPFWQQTWFVVLSILSFLALLFSFYKYRIFQLRRIQEVRNRIASDLHDEIGSSLTHVNILSEIGIKTSAEEGQPEQLFKRIGEEVQSSSEALDDIIWSVSSRADTAEDLISRMRRYASELLDVKGISFSLQEEHINEHQTLELELRRDFYLIYKELLRNVIRHAAATEVRLRVSEENHFLWLEIVDNGQGFDPNVPSDRYGLHSIRARVLKWKGHIFIDSSPSSGTSIKVGLPVKTIFSAGNR